jgi:hypothetical protein
MDITLPKIRYKLLFDWFNVYSRCTLLKYESISQTSVASNEKCKMVMNAKILWEVALLSLMSFSCSKYLV